MWAGSSNGNALSCEAGQAWPPNGHICTVWPRRCSQYSERSRDPQKSGSLRMPCSSRALGAACLSSHHKSLTAIPSGIQASSLLMVISNQNRLLNTISLPVLLMFWNVWIPRICLKVILKWLLHSQSTSHPVDCYIPKCYILLYPVILLHRIT